MLKPSQRVTHGNYWHCRLPFPPDVTPPVSRHTHTHTPDAPASPSPSPSRRFCPGTRPSAAKLIMGRATVAPSLVAWRVRRTFGRQDRLRADRKAVFVSPRWVLGSNVCQMYKTHKRKQQYSALLYRCCVWSVH